MVNLFKKKSDRLLMHEGTGGTPPQKHYQNSYSRSTKYVNDSPNYVTPPTTPEMAMATQQRAKMKKMDAPLNVTVVTTEHHTTRYPNNSTPTNHGGPPEGGEGGAVVAYDEQSISGSLISDLTGSIVPHKSSPPKQQHKHMMDQDAKEEESIGTQSDSKTLSNAYDCTNATSGLVEDFFVMMNCNKEEQQMNQQSRKQLSSKHQQQRGAAGGPEDQDRTHKKKSQNSPLIVNSVSFVPNIAQCGAPHQCQGDSASVTKSAAEWRPPVWGQAPTMEDDTTAFASRELEQPPQATATAPQPKNTTTRPSAVRSSNTPDPRPATPAGNNTIRTSQSGPARTNTSLSAKQKQQHDNIELVLKRGQSQQLPPQPLNKTMSTTSSKNLGSGWKKHYQSRNEHHSMMQRAVMGIYSDIDSTVAEEEAAISRAKDSSNGQKVQQDKEATYNAIFGVDPDPNSPAPQRALMTETQPHAEEKKEEEYGIDEGFELQHDDNDDDDLPASEEKTKKNNWFTKKISKRVSQKKNPQEASSASARLSKSLSGDHKISDRYGSGVMMSNNTNENPEDEDRPPSHRIIEPVYAPPVPVEPGPVVIPENDVMDEPFDVAHHAVPPKPLVASPSHAATASSVGSYSKAPATPTRNKTPSPVICEETTSTGQRVIVTAENGYDNDDLAEEDDHNNDHDDAIRNRITIVEEAPQDAISPLPMPAASAAKVSSSSPTESGKKKKKFFFIPRPSKTSSANVTAASNGPIRTKNSFTGSEQGSAVSVRTSSSRNSWNSKKKVQEDEQQPKSPRNRSWNLAGGISGKKLQQQQDEEKKEELSASNNGTTNTPSRKSVTSPSAASVASDASSIKPVKPEWKGTLDKSTGKMYYYHRMSRTTTWSKPPGYDEEQAAYGEAKRDRKTRKSKKKQRKLEKQQQQQEEHQKQNVRSPSSTSLGSSAFSSPALSSPKRPLKTTPTEGPLRNNLSMAESEDHHHDDDDDDEDDLQNYLPGRVATGKSGVSVSSRQRSHYTAQTDTTETTQQIRNTGSRLNRVFESIPETLDSQSTSDISSFVDDSQAGSSNPVMKDYSSRRVAPSRRTANRAPARERELRVEEFDSSSRFSNKRFGLKAETYGRDGVSRVGRPVSPASVQTEDVLSKDGDGANDTSSEIDLHGYDTVSELGHSEAEFAGHREKFDVSQRKALDEAIKNNDWELAASVADGLKDTSFETSATARNGGRTKENREWTQNEVDKFISQNDWDAVSEYIAKMRDTVVNGLSGSGHDGTSPRYNSSTGPPQGVPPQRSNDIHRNVGSNASNAQKHFGARSQLQHQAEDIVSTASSWDSVYRTSSDESEYLSSDDDDESFNLPKVHKDHRRMAT